MFHGSMVALVTPMHRDGAVDEDSLQQLVDFHVANHTNAIVSVGTSGESATLDEAEHCHVIRRTVQMAAGRIPVIAGTGADPGRPLPAFPCGGRSRADAADSLQCPRAHGMRHAAGDR